MKRRNVTRALLIILAFIWIAVVLSSCDTAKKAIKAHNKAERLGYVYKCEPTTITLRDTIKGKDGEDSIVEVLVKVPCPKAEPPKTKWEIRHMAKRERDSMKHIENVLKLRNKNLGDSLRGVQRILHQQKKIVQSETKGKKHESKGEWTNLVYAIIFGLVALICLYLVIKFVKSWNK